LPRTNGVSFFQNIKLGAESPYFKRIFYFESLRLLVGKLQLLLADGKPMPTLKVDFFNVKELKVKSDNVTKM